MLGGHSSERTCHKGNTPVGAVPVPLSTGNALTVPPTGCWPHDDNAGMGTEILSALLRSPSVIAVNFICFQKLMGSYVEMLTDTKLPMEVSSHGSVRAR